MDNSAYNGFDSVPHSNDHFCQSCPDLLGVLVGVIYAY